MNNKPLITEKKSKAVKHCLTCFHGERKLGTTANGGSYLLL